MASHRGDGRAISRRRTPGVVAGAHALERRPGRLLRAAPSLIGSTALTLAVVGTLSAGAQAGTSAPVATTASSGSLHSALIDRARGASSALVLSGRERAVSRDSQREALQDAADQDLQAAAEQQAKERNAALAALAASAEKQAGLIAKDAWQLPVTKGVYHLTARFGSCSGLWSHCHTGLDFAAPTGTPIHAVANGTITEMGSAGAYGNRTIMTLTDGTELWYCHQTAFVAKVGQRVTAGQVIGLVGSTGNTTGPHVHLEVRPGAGDPVDPYNALIAHGLQP